MNFFFSDEYQKLQIFLMEFQSDTLEKNSQFGYQNLRLKFKDIYLKSFHQTTDWLGIDIDEIVALKCKILPCGGSGVIAYDPALGK